METTLDLRALRPGERAAVSAIHHEHAMSQRLMQLGFVPGTQVTCVGASRRAILRPIWSGAR